MGNESKWVHGYFVDDRQWTKGGGQLLVGHPGTTVRFSILELIERYTMNLQYLPQRQRPRPPHIFLQRQFLNTLLQLPLTLQLPLPTSPCCEDILPSLPLNLLTLRHVGRERLICIQLVLFFL